MLQIKLEKLQFMKQPGIIEDFVKFLVDFTNTPNTPNTYGFTPIEFARWKEHVEVKEFLEEYIKDKVLEANDTM